MSHPLSLECFNRYFLFPAHMPASPTMGAFKRASWSSFGSIAFGSFIIAVIKAMRAMAQSGRGSKQGVVRCIVECMLACLDRLVSYFNVYAFTQVAIYGKPYCEAAKDTWNLLLRCGIGTSPKTTIPSRFADLIICHCVLQ